MVNIKHAKVLCYDLGIFTEQCLRFLRDVAEVRYFCPWIDAFPEPFQSKVGDGLDGMERIEYFWNHVDDADLIFIPDTMCSDVTEFLRKHNYPVAGVGEAEILEMDRWKGREIQRKNGLPTQETYRITGMTELMKFMKANSNFFIKLNMFRGLEETFLHIDWHQSEDTFYDIAHALGPYKESIVFVCEEKMDGCEPGLDAITWEGEMMFPSMVGYEGKGVGIIERVYDTREEFPPALLWLDEGLSPEFKRYGTRFFYSAECKLVKEGGHVLPYLIDVTNRLAAPGTSAIQCEIIKNYSEVIMGLAAGERVNPIFTHKYGAAIPFDSPAAQKSWVNISFPKDNRRWVKLRMAVKKGSDYYAVPGFDSIGSVVGLGNTVEEAMKKAEGVIKDVEGKRIDKDSGQMETILENIEKGRKLGIAF